jgi:UDP-3-O-[3-hydroxymyristoyl] glucosamine N-acyltransferase
VSLQLDAIVQALGGRLVPAGDRSIAAIAPLAQAGDQDISFLSQARYRDQLKTTRAACVIVREADLPHVPPHVQALVCADPYLYYAQLSQLWRRAHARTGAPAIHPSAVIDPSAVLGEGVQIGPLCVIEAGAVIGAGSRLAARVTVGQGCRIGQRAVVHSGAVIGADGFGFAPAAGRWEKIEQLGAVRIGDDVEIGANTCIDRGALEDTVLEDGVKLDNLVQIGHNVRVGAHTAMAGCVGVAGSAVIGAHCTIGGGAVVLGHLRLADHVHISAASVVTRSILRPGQYTGLFPIDDNAAWERNAASLKQLARLRDRLRQLEALLPPSESDPS